MPEETPADLKAAVAMELRAHLEMRHLNYATLEEETGLSRSTLYRIVYGKKSPTIEELALITGRLGTYPDVVLRNALRRLGQG